MDNAQPMPTSCDNDYHTNLPDYDIHVPFSPKERLKLPPNNDFQSWNEADAFMKSLVTPSVLSCTSIDEMNATLNKYIYDYFSSKHGTLPHQSKKAIHRYRSHLQSSLLKARRDKNQMKKRYRKACRDHSISKEAIAEMSKSFHELVHQHNKIRKEVLKRNKMNAAKYAIKQCTRNFWSFADKLFSENEISHISPSFTQKQAYEHFRKTYKSSSTNDLSSPNG